MSRMSRKGFSTLELVMFSAIFAIISIAFLSILVTVTKVQVQQTASGDINQQSDFALATVQRLVESSSYIEGTAGVASSGVSLRMSSSTLDPTLLYIASSSLWIKQGSGTAQQLLTPAVSVTNASFTKRSNAGGKDALDVNITINNVGASTTKSIARAFNLIVTRASAATFDSDVLPSTGNAYKIGATGSLWSNINDLVYFYSSNVGIGATTPASKLEVNGGIRLNTGTSKPTCASGIRGTIWFTQAGGGSNDTTEVCMRNASSSYVWTALY